LHLNCEAMQLNLVIPTLRRPSLLRALLTSIARAAPPRAMHVSITIVNNDEGPLVLEPEFLAPSYPVRILQERRPGKSAALNLGIAASPADFIGLIDDDEEIAADWFQVVERALDQGKFDFVERRRRRCHGCHTATMPCSEASTPGRIVSPTVPSSRES
jgi:glycosyltransferase involved in cell wall biosynthesis